MTDDERKAADGPDYKPGRHFLLLSGDTILGQTQLEWECAGDGEWLREGGFEPTVAYFPFQPLMQEYSRACLCVGQVTPPANDLAIVSALRTRIDALNLRITTTDGVPVPVSNIEIQDFADTLREDPRELSVTIRDRSVHATFFVQQTP